MSRPVSPTSVNSVEPNEAMYQARRTDSDLDIVCEQHRESDCGKLERNAPVGVGVLGVELVLHRDTSNCTEIGGDDQADECQDLWIDHAPR